jgi:LacI family transcriptional regulator
MEKQPEKRSRMIDIARAANVSRTAVTHVLTGAGAGKIGGVSKAKADEIRRIAAELGYIPNRTAQQLAGKRSGMIGVIASQWWSLENRFFTALIDGCDPYGFDVLPVQAKNKTEFIERLSDKWLGRGVEVIIVLALLNDVLWTEAAETLTRTRHTIFVVVSPEIEGSYAIESDLENGIRQILDHLAQRGRTKPVILLEDLECKLNKGRYDAFEKILAEQGATVQPEQLCLATKGWDNNYYPQFVELARDMLERKPDAIICDTDYSALFLIKAFAELGVKVPDDIALVGWGDEIASRWSNPLLTTVSYEFAEIVKATLEMINNWEVNPQIIHPQSTLIPMKLIVRESS